MDLYTEYQTNQKLEKDGITVHYGVNDRNEPITFTIRRKDSIDSDYNAELRKRVQPYTLQIQNGTVDVKILEKIDREVFASTVVVGWSGVLRNGVEVPFSVENCIELLTLAKPVHVFLDREAANYANFKKAELDAVEKN